MVFLLFLTIGAVGFWAGCSFSSSRVQATKDWAARQEEWFIKEIAELRAQVARHINTGTSSTGPGVGKPGDPPIRHLG